MFLWADIHVKAGISIILFSTMNEVRENYEKLMSTY